jgi:hypothetical protein
MSESKYACWACKLRVYSPLDDKYSKRRIPPSLIELVVRRGCLATLGLHARDEALEPRALREELARTRLVRDAPRPMRPAGRGCRAAGHERAGRAAAARAARGTRAELARGQRARGLRREVTVPREHGHLRLA